MDSDVSILLVDSDTETLKLLEKTFKKTGYGVQAVGDGEEALKVLESDRPDLIISEITLPKLDGWELCWKVRERSELADIPFIFLTTRKSTTDEVISFELGADDYIKKPFVEKELLARIKALLTRVERVRNSLFSAKGIKGSLRDMSLADILQVMNMGKRTAAIHLSKGKERGTVFVADGNVTHARCGELKGEEAVFRLLSWNNGGFLVETGVAVDVRSITMSTSTILLEAFKRIDEENRWKPPAAVEPIEDAEMSTLKVLFDQGIIREKRRELS